jgi:hypothetical protein
MRIFTCGDSDECLYSRFSTCVLPQCINMTLTQTSDSGRTRMIISQNIIKHSRATAQAFLELPVQEQSTQKGQLPPIWCGVNVQAERHNQY